MGTVPLTQALGGLNAAWSIVKALTQPLPSPPPTGPWRPPQWSTQPQIYSITAVFPATGSLVSSSINGAPTSSTPTNVQFTAPTTKIYFFDAVFTADHEQEMVITKHPVQTGAPIADHAYLLPARLVLEIGISDAMMSYASGQYTSFASKSVSAFQTFLGLQAARVLMTVSSRLKTYQNMLITNVRAREEQRTKYALRASITFEQIFLASTAQQAVSAASQVTDSTAQGPVNTAPPAPAVEEAFQVTPPGFPTEPIPGIPIVPGSGAWSSAAQIFQANPTIF